MKRLVIVRKYDTGKEFCVNWAISEKRSELFTPPFSDEDIKRKLNGIGAIGTDLLHALFAIKGIDSLWLNPEKLEVTIGEAYTSEWPEIVVQITAAFLISSGDPTAVEVTEKNR